MIIYVNQKEYQVGDEELGRPLLWVLRDELNLTGTKYGCGIGICGSCTVHIDGKAVRSCLTSLASVEGKQITTIEGLAERFSPEGGLLHPVQQAFVDEQVPQCGPFHSNLSQVQQDVTLEQTPAVHRTAQSTHRGLMSTRMRV